MSEPITPRYGQVDRDYGMKLATTSADDDGPVWMVNLMHYREKAHYADGRPSDISGCEADDLYMPLGPLAEVSAEIVFSGDVDRQFLGDSPTWDRVVVVKYPTRRSFIEMQSLPEFRELHHHKDAGMAQTIVMGAQPMEAPQPHDADWSSVPHPPTDEDGPVTLVHVIRFEDIQRADEVPADMASYQNAAGAVAVPHGVRVDGWFSVEGTIIGDGRTWHQVRFNTFPSKAAFMTVVRDRSRRKAEASHRDVAIADTYTVMVQPTSNLLRQSQG